MFKLSAPANVRPARMRLDGQYITLTRDGGVTVATVHSKKAADALIVRGWKPVIETPRPMHKTGKSEIKRGQRVKRASVKAMVDDD